MRGVSRRLRALTVLRYILLVGYRSGESIKLFGTPRSRMNARASIRSTGCALRAFLLCVAHPPLHEVELQIAVSIALLACAEAPLDDRQTVRSVELHYVPDTKLAFSAPFRTILTREACLDPGDQVGAIKVRVYELPLTPGGEVFALFHFGAQVGFGPVVWIGGGVSAAATVAARPQELRAPLLLLVQRAQRAAV
jgi:hypothetical protein